MPDYIILPRLCQRGLETKSGYKDAHYTLRPSGDSVDIWLYQSIDSLHAPKKEKLPGAKLLRICKRLDGCASLKGRDFFSPRDDYRNTTADATLRSLLGDIKTKGNQKCPKFLCIGAEGCVLDNQSNPADPRNQNTLDIAGATLENYISIISIIVWPASKRLSLLTASDAYHSTETKSREFLRKNPNGLPPHILIIKASHHGATSTPPPQLLNELNPQKVIISARQEYGHPSE